MTKEDVTQEIIDQVMEIIYGWYGDGCRIDWENVLDRLEGNEVADGRRIDLGNDLNSPAIRKIKSVVRKILKSG